MRIRFTGVVFILLFALAAVPLIAQQATGIISGTVIDPAGLAVAGAKVEIINAGTKYSQTFVTAKDGRFRFPAVPVGTYTVSIEKQHFRPVKYLAVNVTERQVSSINSQLTIGVVNGAVVVTGEQPVIQTEDPVVQHSFDSREVVRFGVDRLIATLPQNTSGGVEGWLTINGGRTENNRWTIDGAQNQESLNRTAGSTPDVEAIQEVNVVSTIAKAEQGQSSAQINIVTKSGGDSLHGHAAVPLPNAWNQVSRNFFQARTLDPDGNPVDPHSTGIGYYSGSVGGPVILPGYNGRGKTHFFLLYGGQRSDSPTLTNLGVGVVPSDEFRQGDFSSIAPPAGGVGVIRDPETGEPFPDNKIPDSRIDPLAKKIISDFFPDPNVAGGGYYNQKMTSSSLDTFMAKIDQSVGARHALSFNVNGTFVDTVLPATPLPAFMNDSQLKDIHGGVSDIFTITPRLVNEFRAMVYRNHLTLDPQNGIDPKSYGFTGLNTPTANFPYLSISGYAAVGFPSQVGEITNSFEVKDDISRTQGKHGLKFGVDYIWNQGVQNNHILTSGELLYLGLGTAGLCPPPIYYCGGNAFADFLLGRPYLIVQDSPAQSDIRYKALNLYAQDDWKVLPRLTLSFGVRWEADTAPADAKKRMSAYRPGMQSTRYPTAPAGIVFPGDPGIPDGTVASDFNNIAPRFGFAFDLTGRATTVLRGGYGIYYQTNPLRQPIQGSVNQPFTLSYLGFPLNVEGSTANPYGTGINPFPYDFEKAGFVKPYSIVALAKNYVTPYTQQISLDFEQQLLTKDYSLDIGYIGALGTHLQGHNEYNAAIYEPGATALNVQQRRPDQNFSTISLFDSNETSNFHSLVVSFYKRYSNGFSYNAGYTWSKNIDSGSLVYGPTPQNPYDLAAERALSLLDVRNKFSGTFLWDLPFWNHPKGVLQTALGSWQLNGLWSFHSGSPMNLLTGGNNSFNGVYTDRPDQVGDWQISGGRSNIEKVAKWFDTSAFVENAPGTFGNSRRDTIIGPNYKSVDLGVVKKFSIGEVGRLEFETHATNIFNRANFEGFVTPSMNAANYGQLTTAYGARNISFILKLYY